MLSRTGCAAFIKANDSNLAQMTSVRARRHPLGQGQQTDIRLGVDVTSVSYWPTKSGLVVDEANAVESVKTQANIPSFPGHPPTPPHTVRTLENPVELKQP